jgi:cystathionine beta-lyase
MLGVVTANETAYPEVRRATQDMGACAGSEECNLGLRGLRTLEVRLARHHSSGIRIAQWLAARPEVSRVLHPAMPGCVGHDLWARDFGGASGLFSCVFNERFAVHRFVDALRHFKIGFSWGGFESLVLPAHPETRQHPRWTESGPVLRFHVGLEDPVDLEEDLARAFAAAGAAP